MIDVMPKCCVFSYHCCCFNFFLFFSFLVGNQVLQDCNNFGSLNSCNGVKDAVLLKQMESLQKIFLLMQKTL